MNPKEVYEAAYGLNSVKRQELAKAHRRLQMEHTSLMGVTEEAIDDLHMQAAQLHDEAADLHLKLVTAYDTAEDLEAARTSAKAVRASQGLDIDTSQIDKAFSISNVSEDLAVSVIDLSAGKQKKLDEFVLTAIGQTIKSLLGAMFNNSSLPVSIKGTPREISSFSEALGKEKNYMESYIKYGLDDPRTYRSKSKLENAISKFERNTGLKWPFK